MYTFLFYAFPFIALAMAYRVALPKIESSINWHAFFRPAIICIAVGAVLFRIAFPEYTHRFRVTIAVDDDGQRKVGTGIITVTLEDVDYLLVNQRKWNMSARGPAPWVDLGDEGVVAMAVFLPSPITDPVPYDGGSLSFVAYYGAKHHDPKLSDSNIRNISSQTGPRVLRSDQMPQFIWFPDPKNPHSAQLAPADKFEQVIGPGVKLADVTVEITQDKPDNSLYAALPWLSNLRSEEANKLVIHGAPFVVHADYLLGSL